MIGSNSFLLFLQYWIYMHIVFHVVCTLFSYRSNIWKQRWDKKIRFYFFDFQPFKMKPFWGRRMEGRLVLVQLIEINAIENFQQIKSLPQSTWQFSIIHIWFIFSLSPKTSNFIWISHSKFSIYTFPLDTVTVIGCLNSEL